MSKQSQFDQALLLDDDNLSIILERIKQDSSINNNIEFAFVPNQASQIYRNNNLIRVDGIGPEILMNIITMLEKKLVEPFLQITPAQASALFPTIKIWHVNNKGESVRINIKDHYEEQNLKTRKYFSENEKQEKNTKEFQDFMQNNTSSGVGIKSLSVLNRNERPGDVNIQCDLELIFDDIISLMQGTHKELFRVPKTINNSNPIDFRLKLLVGWAVPEIRDTFFPQELTKAIERTQQMYMLALVQHSLTFNENGSISLKLEYQGALENVFYSPESDLLSLDRIFSTNNKNVFDWSDSQAPTGKDFGAKSKQNALELNDIAQERNEYAVLKQAENDAIKKIEALDSEKEKDHNNNSNNEEIETLTKELEPIRERISKIKESVKEERYAYILNTLIQKSKLYTSYVQKESYNFSYSFLPENVVADLNSRDKERKDSYSPFIDLMPEKQNFTTSGFPKIVKIDNLSPENRQLLKITDEASSSKRALEILGATKSEDSDSTAKLPTEVIIKSEKKLEVNPQGRAELIEVATLTNKLVHYIMLGDIIEIAAEFLETDQLNHIILGPISLRNGKIVNIADIPIPIESFTNWFISKITSKDKDKWFFKEFIKDILEQLVGPYMLGKYDLKGNRIQFDVTVETLHSPNKIERGEYISAEQIKGMFANTFFNKEEGSVYTYLLLYATNNSLIDLNGNYFEDLDRGIYHFKVGGNAGIFKNVTFSKIDNNKLRTARMANDQLNFEGEYLREHYNCSVNLIGNHLFQPGKLFYIDGSYLGALGRESAHLIGLGGYYMTTEVKHTLAPGPYVTNIGGFWQDMGTGKGNEGTLSYKSEGGGQ